MFEAKIVENIPSVYNKIVEIQTVGEIEEELFAVAIDEGNNFISNSYIPTMTNYGLSRLEHFLDIPDTSSKTIEMRRLDIMSRYNSYQPITYSYLIAALDTALGKGNYELKPDFLNYGLTIVTHLNQNSYLEELKALLSPLMPCNIDYHIDNQLIPELNGAVYLGGVVSVSKYHILDTKEA